ncbi:hypothetical protein [Streptomyces sp. NPDC051636]|uniref:hypothetical protein n=1 Tax=Streptomyces sp. NPDC051636 TaxID=3365663 RepID=UPI0037B3D196
MSHAATPTSRRTLDEWLARARTKDRYDAYDLTAAKARLLRRRDLRRKRACPVHGGENGGAAEATALMADTSSWTAPGMSTGYDIDHAWRDLQAASLIMLLSPKADRHLAAFIDCHYAHLAGARTFGCLLYLCDYTDGARFWWQFAAGAGDEAAEYCLFLNHAQHGESHDAEHWGRQLARHGFAPEELLGHRAAAPVLTDDLSDCVAEHITERDHPDLGVIPFPRTPLIRHVRELATIPTGPCGRTT